MSFLSKVLKRFTYRVALAGGWRTATMTGNDREHDTRIAQLRIDVTRLEGAQKDLKAEILTELRELRNELRERNKGGK